MATDTSIAPKVRSTSPVAAGSSSRLVVGIAAWRRKVAGLKPCPAKGNCRSAPPACHRILLALILAFLSFGTLSSEVGAANEFYGLGGITTTVDNGVESYSWLLGYTQDVVPHVAMSVCYLNEGHLDNHRRDGYAAQVWGRVDLLDNRLNLGLGFGPYLSFDTQEVPGGYVNRHSWLGMTSAAATWRTDGALILVLRSNYVLGERGPDTFSVLGGIGVEFREDTGSKVTEFQRADNEITLLSGQTIVNSLGSPTSTPLGIEYRRALRPHLDWSVSLIDEGDNRQIHRSGAATQLWATQDLHHHRFVIGAGAGPYFERHGGDDRSRVSGILGLTGSYRITPHWAVRLIWDRVVTGYDRDADLLLAGVGFKF